ncbi:MAG: GxxExxY protein [Phycisphaeraceae bacterium]|nr:GxxExxY protein [Phycisphaeraceae bacterium]
MLHSELTGKIISAAVAVHDELGPGLLESAYEACLCFELMNRGLSVRRQVDIPIIYRETHLECGYRADIVVENSVIVEAKSVEAIAPIHEAQLLTYLRLSGIRVGLLINFNQLRVTDHLIRRIV